MKSNYSIYDLLSNSYINTFGFNRCDEDTVYKFFDSICYRNCDKVVRLYTDDYPLKHNKFENYTISTIEEIYEIISKLKNNIIVIDNIGMLTAEGSMKSSMIIKKFILDLREHCGIYDCNVIMGNFTYTSLDKGQIMGGSSSIVYSSDNVFMVRDGLLSCQKSRDVYTDEYTDINIKAVYLREDNLKKLLDD